MKAVVSSGPVSYVGFDEKDNGKIWLTERESGKYTYVHCQANEFSQPFICIVAVAKEMLPDYEIYLHEFPSSVREKIMSGATGYTFWHGKTYWHFDKDEAVNKAKDFLKTAYKVAEQGEKL